jgi:APA family basic amino acid/polyamine antiporter
LAAILVSVFGTMNGMSLAGARIYYAMAKDGVFFKSLGRVHPKYHTPAFALMVQAVWACLLTLSGKYNELLDLVMFAVMAFYVLTVLGLFVLRKKQPNLERPYRAMGYPILPALYIVLASLISIAMLHEKPYALPGLLITLSGIPFYFLWKKKVA